MSLRKTMILVAAMMFLLPASKAIALESITCSDIEWSSAVTDRIPDIKDACYDVVERNGKVMAKIKVKIMNMDSDDITYRFIRPDDTLSGVYRMPASSNMTEAVKGAMLDSGGLKYGMTMDAYVTNAHWRVNAAGKHGLNLAEVTGPIEVRGSVTESEPTADVRSVKVMPDTASKVITHGSITCSDIEWSSSVTDRIPDIKDACHDVVEINGNAMAKIKVMIMKTNSSDINFRFVRPDDTLSGVYRMPTSTNFQGAMLDSGGLKYGMTMNAYVTNAHWRVNAAGKNRLNLAEATGPIEVRGSVTESEPTDDVKSAKVMPDTAGPLPLIGLLGAGFIALGGGIRLFRRSLH